MPTLGHRVCTCGKRKGEAAGGLHRETSTTLNNSQQPGSGGMNSEESAMISTRRTSVNMERYLSDLFGVKGASIHTTHRWICPLFYVAKFPNHVAQELFLKFVPRRSWSVNVRHQVPIFSSCSMKRESRWNLRYSSG